MLMRGSCNVLKWTRFTHTHPALLTAATTENSFVRDDKEIEHHSKLAKEWWNPKGPVFPLLSMNAIRVPFIRDGLIATNRVNPEFINTPQILDGLEILEIGCGGGILTEHLARLNANVTGIDLGDNVIQAAKEHLKTESPELIDHVTYKVEPIEVHMKDNLEKYDAVVLSEVLEHISDKAGILAAAVPTLKPGGSIFITTINKTFLAWLGGIFLAENVFKFIPKGTHHYDMLAEPLEIQRILDALNCPTILVNGFVYDFFRDTWRWIPSNSLSYGLQAVKN